MSIRDDWPDHFVKSILVKAAVSFIVVLLLAEAASKIVLLGLAGSLTGLNQP